MTGQKFAIVAALLITSFAVVALVVTAFFMNDDTRSHQTQDAPSSRDLDNQKPHPTPDQPTTEMPTVPEEPVACTMDAKECPDGSYVGRVAPDCEFAACSGAADTPSVPSDDEVTMCDPNNRPEMCAEIYQPGVRASAGGMRHDAL